MSDYIDEFFGPGGVLAKAHPSYSARPGQIQMARAVDHAIVTGDNAMCEAGTGTGKTLAYLVPAIYHALANGRGPVMVATANIALQEQLVNKDLPFLEKVIPWKKKDGKKFRFALLKGKSNYICPVRMERALARGAHGPTILKIRKHLEQEPTGDVSRLPCDVAPELLPQLCGHSEECTGERCRRTMCGAGQARAIARTADVIVCNYALFFTDLQVRENTGGKGFLPDWRTLICDEAHEVAEVARDHLGWRMTAGSFIHVQKSLPDNMARDLERCADAVFGSLLSFARSPMYKARLRPVITQEWGQDRETGYRPPTEVSWPAAREVAALIDGLQQATLVLQSRITESTDVEQKEELHRAVATCDNAMSRLDAALACRGNPSTVYFVEIDKEDRASLNAKEVYVAAWIRRMVFDAQRRADGSPEPLPCSIVFSSATLSTGQSFEYITSQTGFRGNVGLSVPSPFDFRSRCLVVVPEMKTNPTQQGFTAEVAEKLTEIIRIVKGRTLGLFTSYKALNEAHGIVAKRVPYTVLKQGVGDRSRLIARFRDELSTCLFGTSSLWVGVDVPGAALTCLAIDKLPFPNPADPVMDAIQAGDSSWFENYSLPYAITLFKQGVGRLIRSESDYGVVVLFDARLVEKRYGQTFFSSLPACQFTRRVEDIGVFLAQFEGGFRRMSSVQPILAIVDAHNLLHRILHVRNMQELMTTTGVPTGGVFGFVTSLRMMLDRTQSGACVVVWDGGHSDRRKAIYPEYKVRRFGDEKDEKKYKQQQSLFDHQRAILHEVLPRMGVRQVSIHGKEADDVMGLIASRSAGPVVILSEDKDMLQLVSERVQVYRPMQEVLVDVESFRKHTGVARALFLMRLALLGDDSDGISSIHGVGDVTVGNVISVVEFHYRAKVGFDVLTSVRPWSKNHIQPVSAVIDDVVGLLAEIDKKGRRRYEAFAASYRGVLERNLDLMDVSLEAFTEMEEAALATGLTARVSFDELWLGDTVTKLEFHEAIKSWSGWSAPFRRLS